MTTVYPEDSEPRGDAGKVSEDQPEIDTEDDAEAPASSPAKPKRHTLPDAEDDAGESFSD